MANPPQLPNLSDSMGLESGLRMADVVKIIRTGGGGKAKANAKFVSDYQNARTIVDQSASHASARNRCSKRCN